LVCVRKKTHHVAIGILGESVQFSVAQCSVYGKKRKKSSELVPETFNQYQKKKVTVAKSGADQVDMEL
jgi:hypothetical protein